MKRKQFLSVLLALALALSAFTIVPFAAGDAWDGTTATQPAGSGTQEDPYQISSAANLLWMSQNIKKGDTVAEDAPEATDGTYGPSFAGVYFKQTCDIDLGGKSLPSIGYYYGNETRMAAFGGVYDGNGFTIRGGTIAATYDDCALEHDWGYGLFGVIYGAVIRNVQLEDVTVVGYGVTGGIVGRAAAPTGTEESPAAADEDFNVIENCAVRESCTLQAGFGAEQDSASGIYDQASRVGGIVGMAYGTTIRNCVNEADLSLPGNFSYAGGIAGTAGFGSRVEYCSNSGDITVTIGSNPNKAESAYAGIVGFVSPYGTGTSGSYNEFALGGLTIANCYNTGTFAIVGETLTNAVYWGGILGGANSLQYGQTYRITNCYNLNDRTSKDDADFNNYRIGGLLGVYWISGGARVAPLYIDNSWSVEIVEGGNQSGYGGTNEYRCYPDRANSDGLICVQVGLADGTYTGSLNGSYPEGATVGTKTADEILALTKEIDRVIEANSPVQYDTWDGSVDTTWFDPDDIQESYELDTAAKVAGLAQLVKDSGKANFPQADAGHEVTFYITANLDLAGLEWLPIGNTYDTRFGGNLVGRVGAAESPAIIRGLNVTGTAPNTGFVGSMDQGGEISGFTFESPRVSSTSDTVGVVCGYARSGGTFRNITVTDALIEAENADWVGGICAYSKYGADVYENCVFDGDIVVSGSTTMVGGIVGNAVIGATLTGCYTSGSIAASGKADMVGGLVGFLGNHEDRTGGSLTVTDSQSDIIVYNANTEAAATGALLGTALGNADAEKSSKITLEGVFLSGLSMVAGEKASSGFAWIGGLSGSGSVTLSATGCNTLSNLAVLGVTNNAVTLSGGDSGITVRKLADVAGDKGKDTIGDEGWVMRSGLYPVVAAAEFAAPTLYGNADYAWFNFEDETLKIGTLSELVGFSVLSKLYSFGGKTVQLTADIDGLAKLPDQVLGAGGELNENISTGFAGSFDRNGFSFVNLDFELGDAATYVVTWIVGSERQTQSYKYGETPVYDGEPSRPNEGNYSYTFTGWDKEIVPVTGDVTYTATWRVTNINAGGDDGDDDGDDGEQTDEPIQTTEPSGAETTAPAAADDKGCKSAAGMSLTLLGVAGALALLSGKRKKVGRDRRN